MEMKYEKGCLLIDYGKYSEAMEIFNEILREDEKNYEALNKVGVIYARQGDLENAQKHFEKVLDKDKNYGPALVNMGNVYKELGDEVSALEYYSESIRLDPDYYLAYYNLGVLYKEKQMFETYMKYMKEYKRRYRYHMHNSNASRYKDFFSRKNFLSKWIIPILLVIAAIVLIQR